MKDHYVILKAIGEILEKPHQADLQRLTSLCWVLDCHADWTSAQEIAQTLLDTSSARLADDCIVPSTL